MQSRPGTRSISLVRESRPEAWLDHKPRSAEFVKRPSYGFTRDWLRNHLVRQQNLEKKNWWSDESGTSDTEPQTAAASEKGNPSLDIGPKITRVQSTEAALLESDESWLSTSPHQRPTTFDRSTVSDHKYLPSDTTLRQGHFEDVFGPARREVYTQLDPPRSIHSCTAMAPGLAFDHDAHVEDEKPLPPAPFVRTASEAPVVVTNANSVESPLTEKRPSFSSMTSFQRPKKRILWRGKICVVALPLDDGNDRPNGPVVYLQPQAISARLTEWEAKGFDIQGFDLAPQSGIKRKSDGQSRDIYPDPSDWQREWHERQCRVNVPNRKAWEDYVAQLKEEKLRALGVSFGGEEVPSGWTPVSSSMSRQPSSQSSMLPPSLPTSAAGLRGQLEHKFSPPLSAAANSLVRSNSMIAPSPHQYPGRPANLHATKQSISFHGEYPDPQFSGQYPTPPFSGAFSQQLALRSLPGSRGVSPLINGRRESLHGTLFPLAPMVETTLPGHFAQPYSLPPNLRQQRSPIPSQPLREQSQQPGIVPLPTDELHPVRYNSQPEIASPLPQGHRHNLSETLQKEIDDAEYHLEESLRRQLEEDDKVARSTKEAEEQPELQDHRRTNGGSRNARISTEASDIDTNISSTGSENERKLSKHSSRASLSKLNVNAQEFVFYPSKPIASNMFSFSGNTAKAVSYANSLDLQAKSTNWKSPSHGPVYNNTYNVVAPSVIPSNTHMPPMPSREFSFSSSMPALRPDAPSFMPRGYSFNANSGSDVSGSEKPQSKISSDSGLSRVVKPAKNSKAIPIVKPDRGRQKDDIDSDFKEDADGRITLADGRQKRLRRTEVDGDEVPLFATPSNEKLAGSESTEKPRTSQIEIGDELSLAEQVVEPSNSTPGDTQASTIPSTIHEVEERGKADTQSEAFELEDSEEMANFNAARPRSVTPGLSEKADKATDLPLKEGTEIIPQKRQAESGPDPSLEVDKPELLATVGPLEYNAVLGDASSSDEHETHGVGRETEPPVLIASRHVPKQVQNGSPSLSLVRGESEDDYQSHTEQPLSSESHLSEGVTYVEPSFQEIDAVMKHLNGGESDIHSEPSELQRSPVSPRRHTRSPSPVYQASPSSENRLRPINQQRIPSSSPNRLQQPFQYLPERSYDSSDSAAAELVARNARFSPSFKPSRHPEFDSDVAIHRLNDPDNVPVSDWDDAVSSVDNPELQLRTGFFDQRVNDMIGSVVQEHLRPLEQNLATMSDALARMSSKPKSKGNTESQSVEAEDSDADDEDDDDGRTSQSRTRSPLKERKYEKLKASVLESIASQQPNVVLTDLNTISQTLEELKNSVQQQKPGSLSDVRAVVEETINRQMRGKSAPITSTHESASAEKHQLHINGLESMLKISEARADDELRARRIVEDELSESKRLLRLAQSEAAAQRESAEETERSLRAFHDERQQVMQRSAVAEAAREDLERTLAELNAKNAAMEETLEEYRLSSAEWREEIEEAKTENKNLDRTIHALKTELEDGIRGRHALRAKIDRLQEEMQLAARDIARDQSLWRQKDEEHKARHEIQNARLEAEARTRERLELDIERLEAQEKEATKSRFLVELVQTENARLVEIVNQLKDEREEHREKAAQYQRELHVSRETTRSDLERLQKAVEVNAEGSSQQVTNVRRDLERVVARLEQQLEDARNDEATAKSRNELMLEEASESRDNALRAAAESRDAALQEHYRFHERTLEEMKALHERSLAAATEERQRALELALQDKQLTESLLKDKLALADEKITHYQDRLDHLEEKLSIAQAAAQAAIQAAQSARSSSPTKSIPHTHDSSIPGKLSPQALRESILVLQEQLHERETRVESLQHDLSQADRSAPTKLKDRDLEISWLRELLGLRTDDLQDLIRTLSSPDFDRDAARDAAIRLKANLQMELQEKERAAAVDGGGGAQTFPSLATISSLASSPRALPMAAAAAWGNWRKAQLPFSSLAEIANGAVGLTPSKSSSSSLASPQGFLSGLLTPPSTAPVPAVVPREEGRRPLQGYATPVKKKKKMAVDGKGEGEEEQEVAPVVTPTLLRMAEYDGDAESTHYSLEGYVVDGGGEVVGGKREVGEVFGGAVGA